MVQSRNTTICGAQGSNNRAMAKPRLSFGEIFNMSFGFLGIQFGWGLQLANMSAIYTKLHADPDQIPFLWLAGPVTGLVVQPIIGSLSDRTWGRFGRRRPYFSIGALFASIALFAMPTSPSLWFAATMLWVLDASINVSMEPFRAFVADKLDASQRTVGFVMQSFFIGIGATLANGLPYLLHWVGVEGTTESGIPLTVKYSFQVGALVFFCAVLYTVLTTSEYPPEDAEAFKELQSHPLTGAAVVKEVFSALRDMPRTMKQLAVVQFFTWLGLFCMWMFFGLAIARHVFKAEGPGDPSFDRATEWGGICFAMYSVVCFVVAFALPEIAKKTSRKFVHAASLVCGGAGLLGVYFVHDQNSLLVLMGGVGIAWASILSMPYAMLSTAIPAARMGVYMGIFNFFIVLPEIVASLTFKPLVKFVFQNEPLYVVVLGGACMLIAAACVALVDDVEHQGGRSA